MSQPSKCLKFMTFWDVLSYMLNTSTEVKFLRLFITISVTKDEKDNISQLDDYNVLFCEQQDTHWSCCISLFKFKSFYQFNPPKQPQILDIYSVVAI